MIFPFRHSSIFKSRWIALAWAAGICFMASEIVDSLSSVTGDTPKQGQITEAPASSDDPVAVALQNAPPPRDMPPPAPSSDILR